MIRIMFLCTGNSCRSQMAEGFARELGKGILEPYSAGIMPAGFVHPNAVRVMKKGPPRKSTIFWGDGEEGIDISKQSSNDIDHDLLNEMDMVITLCGHVEASCPVTPPEIKRIHWPIDDPIGTVGTEEEVLNAYRKARDEIKARVLKLIEEVKDAQKIS